MEQMRLERDGGEGQSGQEDAGRREQLLEMNYITPSDCSCVTAQG